MEWAITGLKPKDYKMTILNVITKDEINEIKLRADGRRSYLTYLMALHYINKGFLVLPCMPDTKNLPKRVDNIKMCDASGSLETVEEWFGNKGKYKGWNIALATGRTANLFVLDVDVKKKDGNTGMDNLAELVDEHGDFETTTATTPSGGKHYFFKWSEGGMSSTSKIAPSLDTLGGKDDAMLPARKVMVYPSTFEGTQYRWSETCAMTDIPTWLKRTLEHKVSTSLKGDSAFHGMKIVSDSARGSEEVTADDNYEEYQYSIPALQRMLECIEVGALDYEDWIMVIQAIHSQHSGGDGLALADHWCSGGDSYEAGEVHKRWDGFAEEGKVRIGTVIHLAKLGGFDITAENKKSENTGKPCTEVDKNDVIAEYNARFGVVDINGTIRVLRVREPDATNPSNYTLYDMTNFDILTKPEVIAREKKILAKSRIWISHENRKEYTGITFSPSGLGDVGRYYNRWNGFAMKPSAGDCSFFLTHVMEMVNGNQEHYDWLIDWCADLIQDPSNPKGCAVITKGNEGTGKGTFAQVIGKLVGRYFIQILQEGQLTGRFNSHLEDALVVFADEVTFGGSKKEAGVLKGLVTERERIIERKGMEPVNTKSYVRLITASNNDWVIPAGSGSRRWFVIELTDKRIGDMTYWNAFHKSANNGGYEALMEFLLNRKIKSNLRTAPVTKALKAQRTKSVLSESSILDWWSTLAMTGVHGIPTVGCDELDKNSWGLFVKPMDLYEAYNEWALRNRVKYPTRAGLFGSEMKAFYKRGSHAKALRGLPTVKCVELHTLEACIEILKSKGAYCDD